MKEKRRALINRQNRMRKQLSPLSYLELVTFYFYISGFICNRPLIRDKRRFPDSSFTASASSESHSPSDARISSGSSWCAPVADGKHYLEVDLGRLYVIYRFRTFGASSCFKWVTTYKLNYTVDLINWKPVVKKKVIIVLAEKV
jgi:hypothetical protein